MAQITKLPANPLFIGNNQFSDAYGNLASSGYYKTYYVDGNNGSATGDGLSWATALNTLSAAMVLSHASIAAGAEGWAARNRILVKADAITEDLVKFAQKTDVIGVGSMDWRSKASIVGNHVVPSTVSYMGCRFINMEFQSPAAGGDIITMTSQHGIEFLGCSFRGNSTTPATGAIIAVACVDLKIDSCEFTGAFSDAVIEFGAGQADGFKITNNFIQGANMGIDIPNTITLAANKVGLIKDNVISSTLACINDAEGTNFVIGNRLRTAAAKGSAMAGCIVCGITYAQDNRCTTSDANNVVYPAEGAI